MTIFPHFQASLHFHVVSLLMQNHSGGKNVALSKRLCLSLTSWDPADASWDPADASPGVTMFKQAK